MFTAGLETDINEMKKTGLASLIIAIIGVIVPLGTGWAISSIFNTEETAGMSSILMQNIFIGVILTATSVSITVETLKEMGKLSSKSGNAIIGAAVIDDILGIIVLTVITSTAESGSEGSGGDILMTVIKILLFFVFAIIVALLFNFIFNKWSGRSKKDLRRYVIIAFVFCLIMSFSAEYLFGVADITGAFVAGLALSNGPRANYLNNRFGTLSYMLLSPVFFASIGLQVVLPEMSISIILFSLLLLVGAIISKIIGCGLGAKLCRFSNKDSIRIGAGMVSRGEVALIVASKGAAVGLMKDEYFAPVVIVVVVTTIITPILLKFAYKSKDGENESVTQKPVTEVK